MSKLVCQLSLRYLLLPYWGILFTRMQPNMSLKSKVFTADAPKPGGPYSQGLLLETNPKNKMLFLSGQLPLDPKTMRFVEGGIKEQTRQTLNNLGSVLKACGADFK